MCAARCADRLHGGSAPPYDRGDGLPPRDAARAGRVQQRAGHVHRAGARPPAEPAQGAAPRRPDLGDRGRDGRLQARRRARAGWRRDGRAARPGDRRRPRDRGRLAGRRHGAHRGGRGDRVRGPAGRARQPRAAGLGRRAGEAPGGVGRQAARVLPPGRAERRGPGAARRRGRRRMPRGRPRAVPRAALVRAGRRQAAGRGPPPRRRRDGAPADRAGRRHPQGGVPLRCRGDRRDPLGARPVRSWTPRPRCRGCSCPVASTTRRSSARSRSRAARARAASSWAARCGRRRPRCRARRGTPSSAGAGRDRLARLTSLVDDLAAPWRPRWTAARAPEPPGPGWYQRY